jgi:hypothetical protein
MMNLRCLYCQTPFTLGRPEMLAALVTMSEKHQNHYDAHCPRCRRANSISRQRMELFFPNWREAAKQQASMPAADPDELPSASANLKTEPLTKAVKSAALKTATAKKTAAENAKPSASKRQRASKPASAKKTTPSKASPSKTSKPSSKDKKK